MKLWTLGNSVFGEAPSDGVVILRAKTGYAVGYSVCKGVFLLPDQSNMDWRGGNVTFFKSPPATPADSTLSPREDDNSPKESPADYNPHFPDITPKKKAVNKDALEAPANYNPDPFPKKKNPDSRPGHGFDITGPADGAMPEAERKKRMKGNRYDWDESYPASWPTGLEREDNEKEREKKRRGEYGYGPRGHQTGDS